MLKRILIPTDGSNLSAKAIAYGVKLARSEKAKVIGLFAAPPATPVVYARFLPVAIISPEKHAQMIKQTAAKYLGVIERAATRARVPHECICVTNDFPAEAILTVAKQKKCDLILMASHGYRSLDVLLGTETQKVLAQATLPVLVYR